MGLVGLVGLLLLPPGLGGQGLQHATTGAAEEEGAGRGWSWLLVDVWV